MDFDWLWQEVFGHWAVRLLGIAGGAALPAILKLRNSRFASPLVFGFVGLFLMVSLFVLI